jgi:hypothetical protein
MHTLLGGNPIGSKLQLSLQATTGWLLPVVILAVVIIT